MVDLDQDWPHHPRLMLLDSFGVSDMMVSPAGLETSSHHPQLECGFQDFWGSF